MNQENKYAVIGLGFGDEGKGLVTSFLCNLHKDESPLVVRYNSGTQVGHTVALDEKTRHVFSNFGSGTLQDVPTYWSEKCTFYPTAFLNELTHLKNYLKINPDFYIHPLCPVTTPFDVYANQVDNHNKVNGTVGVGFGKTLQRQEDHYKLFVQDLFYPNILKEKLNNIISYYGRTLESNIHNVKNEADSFAGKVEEILPYLKLETFFPDNSLIFESGQGILLDQDFGFFPNVTRSNTTTKNIFKNHFVEEYDLNIYYVTRTYQTRHGNGFMTNSEYAHLLKLKNNDLETNINHRFQGNFRKTILDIDLLNYSLMCDNYFSGLSNKSLVVTCVDQTGEEIWVTKKGELMKINVNELASHLDIDFESVLYSRGNTFKDIC